MKLHNILDLTATEPTEPAPPLLPLILPIIVVIVSYVVVRIGYGAARHWLPQMPGLNK